ncbi:MAG TPA: TetR/AcrR family transcriptional regulator [Kofleriaceae bacterium]
MVAVKKPAFGGVRTGGRSALVVENVLHTTVQLLGEIGYGALRIEEVAERSGVNKTTIYRRWPTKVQLVTAAIQAHKLHEPPRDTGDLVNDLTEMYVGSLCHSDLPLVRGLQRMMLLEQQDNELAVIRAELRERVLAIRLPRLQLAVRRGELPRGTDVLLLLEMIGGALYSRLLSYREAPTPDLIGHIVRTIIEGARVRSAKSPKRTKPKTSRRATSA